MLRKDEALPRKADLHGHGCLFAQIFHAHADMGAPFSLCKAGRDVQKTEIGAPDLFDGHGAGDPAVRHVIVRHMQGALLGKAVVRDDLERVLPRRHAAHDGGKGRIGIVVARDEGAVEIHLRRVTHALADDAAKNSTVATDRITLSPPAQRRYFTSLTRGAQWCMIT